jgi:hypothetical protein
MLRTVPGAAAAPFEGERSRASASKSEARDRPFGAARAAVMELGVGQQLAAAAPGLSKNVADRNKERAMASYTLVTDDQLGTFAAAARAAGFAASNFELQEEVFDPQTAELEARKGDLGVRHPRTEAAAVYPLGDGSDWVVGFAADLASGRFGGPPRR